MKDLILQTLRQRRTSTIWWSFGIITYILLVMLVYPVFSDQAHQLEQSFQNIPESSKALFSDTDSLFTPEGYLDSNAYYLMIPLLFSVLAIGLGSSLIAREESDHTIELLLSRPISRGRLLTSKAIAGLIILLIVGAAGAVSGAVAAHFIDFGTIGPMDIISVTTMCMVLALIFGAVAFALTGLGKFGKASIGIASLLALSSYLFTSLSGTVEWLRWPARALPFHYFHPAEILQGGRPRVTLMLYLLAAALLGLVAFSGFRRRDLE